MTSNKLGWRCFQRPTQTSDSEFAKKQVHLDSKSGFQASCEIKGALVRQLLAWAFKELAGLCWQVLCQSRATTMCGMCSVVSHNNYEY